MARYDLAGGNRNWSMHETMDGERSKNRLLRPFSALSAGIRQHFSKKKIEEGDKARDQRRWTEAAKSYAAALALNSAQPPIWIQYGHALKESGNINRAEGAYRKAMECGLDDCDSHLQLGHALKLQGKKGEAAKHYCFAAIRDPSNASPLRELQIQGWTRDELRGFLGKGTEEKRRTFERERHPEWPTIVFDITDVLYYVTSARRPSGIQRVQLGVISGFVSLPSPKLNVLFAGFSRCANYWVEIDSATITNLMALMGRDGGDDDPDWQRLLGGIQAQLLTGADIVFPPGARLVNLGSSWAQGNYFLGVRRARTDSNVIYIPFIHDCIPLIAPHFFVPELIRDFREWLHGVFNHADGYLTNSQSTARDLDAAAEALGYAPVGAHPIRLNGAFDTSGAGPAATKAQTEAVLNRLGLENNKFVLFVSTIEPRKNHMLAFQTWLDLIKERGVERVPILACVGGRGWKNGEALEFLEANSRLQEKVKILSNVSDLELDSLFEGCRFTLYPSRYEGWGLPVTESLSKGKLPLVARTSSLPEAGLDFAEYFNLDIAGDFREKLERLLDDAASVEQQENRIKREFRPRSWGEIFKEIVDKSLTINAADSASRAVPVFPNTRFVSFAKGLAFGTPSHITSGEAYRTGSGWNDPDERGCWLTHQGRAEIMISLPDEVKDDPQGCRVYLLLYGGEVTPTDAGNNVQAVNDNGRLHQLQVRIGSNSVAVRRVEAGHDIWMVALIEPPHISNGQVRLHLNVQSFSGAARRGYAVGLRGAYLCGASDRDAQFGFVEGAILGFVNERTELSNPLYPELESIFERSRFEIYAQRQRMPV